MINIFIFGLGHLGKKIVHELERSKENFQVGATYRELSRVKAYEDHRLIEFSINDELPEIIEDAIVFNFPPVQGYLDFLKRCNKKYEREIPWIFVSSTSVFGSGDISEESDRNGEKKNSKHLIELEDYLLSLQRQVTIVRPGGLIDDDRLPGRFMKFKDVIEDSEREINFIHTLDVARFILYALKRNLKGEFNIVSDTPLKRREIYLKTHPGFKCDEQGKARKVSNLKIKRTGFELEFANIRNFLASKV